MSRNFRPDAALALESLGVQGFWFELQGVYTESCIGQGTQDAL